jgi:predicted GNAT family N-acyltransferase
VSLLLRRATLAEILDLRHAVLRPGLPVETAHFDGDDEPATRHFGAFLAGDGEPVGCLSLVQRPFEGEPAWQLRGMATRADRARTGIGRALLEYAVRALQEEHGTMLLWCNARTTAAPFYQRLGWTIVSDIFEISTVGPHVRMVRHL